MKTTLRTIAVILIAFIASSFTIEAQNNNKKKVEEVVFMVNIHCDNCVKKLEANLPFEKGVKGLKVSLEEQTVTFKYQPSRTSEEKLKQAITKLGSPVLGVKPEVKKEE